MQNIFHHRRSRLTARHSALLINSNYTQLTSNWLTTWSWVLFLDTFFGGFLFTSPRLDNVTDDHGYSRLLADFPSVGVGIILLTVRFLAKREGFLRD